MGAKRMPMMNNVGSTVRGVRIGCHAFSRCCLNAVSIRSQDVNHTCRQGHTHSMHHTRRHSLAGLRQLPFSFLEPSPSSPFFLRLKRPIQVIPKTAKPVQRVDRRERPAGDGSGEGGGTGRCGRS